jgi:hypothetical protein
VFLPIGGGTQNRIGNLFERSKSAAQRISIFLAAVIAAPVAEELAVPVVPL